MTITIKITNQEAGTDLTDAQKTDVYNAVVNALTDNLDPDVHDFLIVAPEAEDAMAKVVCNVNPPEACASAQFHN